MPSIEHLKEELDDVRALRSISNALLEISSMRIRTLREDFDRNKSFYEEMSDLYNLVELSAVNRQYNLDKDGTKKKKVIIAITSNQRFHGSLNRIVMESFIAQLEKEKEADYFIVGNTGRRYMEETEYNKGFEFLSFKNDYPTPGETEVFLNKVKDYEQVILFYPKFTNIFFQKAHSIDITYTPKGEIDPKREIEYIFEPELLHILEFFETQIKKLLFMRIMLESELSRTAARLIKMNSTEGKATDTIKEKDILIKKETTILNDIRLLETFSSIVQWKKS